MADKIVDLLEAVEVDGEDRDIAAGFFGNIALCIESFGKILRSKA